MRISLVVLFAASLVSATTMLERAFDAPKCAVECEAKTDPSPCDRKDTPCLCLNLKFITDVSTCIATGCSPEDAEAAVAAGAAYCKEAGIDYESPFPSCGATCDQNSPPAECAYDDGACICENDEYILSFAQCIQDNCTGEDIEKGAFVGKALCRAYGVDITPVVGA